MVTKSLLYARAKVGKLARLFVCGRHAETTLIDGLVNLSLQLTVRLRIVHQVIEQGAKGDGSGVAASKECTIRLLLNISPAVVELVTTLLVDGEDLLCHVGSGGLEA